MARNDQEIEKTLKERLIGARNYIPRRDQEVYDLAIDISKQIDGNVNPNYFCNLGAISAMIRVGWSDETGQQRLLGYLPIIATLADDLIPDFSRNVSVIVEKAYASN